MRSATFKPLIHGGGFEAKNGIDCRLIWESKILSLKRLATHLLTITLKENKSFRRKFIFFCSYVAIIGKP